MAKRVNKLTEGELNQLIKESASKVINEMDAITCFRSHNTSPRAKQDIQRDNNDKAVDTQKFIDNDVTSSRADSIGPEAQSHWLSDYIGQTFKFFGRSPMGLPAHILFSFERATKLESSKTVLVGTVTCNKNQINDDVIIINFKKNSVRYHAIGNRHIYHLEIDNRSKPLWDRFKQDILLELRRSHNNNEIDWINHESE